MHGGVGSENALCGWKRRVKMAEKICLGVVAVAIFGKLIPVIALALIIVALAVIIKAALEETE